MSRRAEESVILACPHCRFPIPLAPKDFGYLRNVFRCPSCNGRSSFPVGARLAGWLGVVAVYVPVLGFAKILGLLGDDTSGQSLISVAILLATVPFALAASTAVCRRFARRLVG